jgi:hypothetical protein
LKRCLEKLLKEFYFEINKVKIKTKIRKPSKLVLSENIKSLGRN